MIVRPIPHTCVHRLFCVSPPPPPAHLVSFRCHPRSPGWGGPRLHSPPQTSTTAHDHHELSGGAQWRQAAMKRSVRGAPSPNRTQAPHWMAVPPTTCTWADSRAPSLSFRRTSGPRWPLSPTRRRAGLPPVVHDACGHGLRDSRRAAVGAQRPAPVAGESSGAEFPASVTLPRTFPPPPSPLPWARTCMRTAALKATRLGLRRRCWKWAPARRS